MTEAEYLKFERSSDTKHEYIDGHVYDMAGASEAHSLITVNLITSLRTQLKGSPCKVYSSDMRIKVPATGLHTYPDLSVMYGEAEFADDEFDTLVNPTLLIEVLSPSTESYDRGKKFQQYRLLPSLKEYLLVSQDSARIERFLVQEADFWQFNDVQGLTSDIHLPSIDCTLSFSEVYDLVTFDE